MSYSMCLLIRYDSNSAGEINIDKYIETEVHWRGRDAEFCSLPALIMGKQNKLILTTTSHTLSMFCSSVGPPSSI